MFEAVGTGTQLLEDGVGFVVVGAGGVAVGPAQVYTVVEITGGGSVGPDGGYCEDISISNGHMCEVDVSFSQEPRCEPKRAWNPSAHLKWVIP